MALVLPILRLWLLFINIYGTFKVIKPPPPSQKSKNGPSSRALQLRKRELKSRLAMWIVWASFLAAEVLLDRTASFITPFYNELKCVVLLFLLVTRSHGAEAIFLHLIHPFLRPYVPAIDDILAHLNSVFELLTLLILIPYEHISEWWSRPWIRPWTSFSFSFSLLQRKQEPTYDNDQDDDASYPPSQVTPAIPQEQKPDNEVRNRLRPRTHSQKSQFQEAEQRAKAIFEQIDEAQDRVRARTRSTKEQLSAVRDQIQQSGDIRPLSSAATGMRTRKRLLEQSANANAVVDNAGSKNTGIHHLDPHTIAQLAKSKGPALSSYYPNTQTDNPPHEIWIPPPPNDKDTTPQSRQSSYRSPSPVYPPFPSAYPFTPRKPDPLQMLPDEIVRPTPRHASSSSPGRSPYPSTATKQQNFKRPHTLSASSSSERYAQESRASDGLHPEDFFQIALESSIHTDMDVDAETLSTLNGGSSATDESTYDDTQLVQATVRKRSTRRIDDTEVFRRSSRFKPNGTTSTPKDEFGFTVPPPPKASPRRQPAVTQKKPLARAKPALKSDGELSPDDTDTESVKKKRKTKVSYTQYTANEDEKRGRTRKSGATTAEGPPASHNTRDRGSTKQVAESSKTVRRKQGG